MKTIAQILKKTKKGDILNAGKRYWRVVETDFDGIIVASPITKKGKPYRNGFEIWSSGIESIAIIPGLKVVKTTQ